MDISIIIPSYKSRKTICLCLDRLIDQKSRLKYEVIVVDSTPDDSVRGIMKKYQKNTSWIFLKNKTNPGIARNIGVEKAKASFLIFLDSDVIVRNNFIDGMYSYYNNGHDIFLASIIPYRRSLMSKLEWFFEFSHYKPRFKEEIRWCLPSYSLGVSKKIFDKVQFRDIETSEDVDFTVRAKKLGYKLHFNPKICVKHIFRGKFLKILKKAKSFGESSMKMRLLYDISGSKLSRNKLTAFFAIPFFGIYKFLRITLRNLVYNSFSDKVLYIFVSPLMIVIIIYWVFGCYRELIKRGK